MKFTLTLLVSFITVFAFSQRSFTPVADARVYQSEPEENFGSKDLAVKNGNKVARYSYVKFDVKGVEARDVKKATLRLFVKKVEKEGTTTQVNAVEVDGNDWKQNDITWNTKPELGKVIATANVNAAEQYVEWDVTDYLRSLKSRDGKKLLFTIGLYDKEGSSNLITFNAKEAKENQPELIIQ